MITQQQAHMLASVLHEIQPRWSIPATMKVLGDHHMHPAPFGDLVYAMLQAARDPKVSTPGIVYVDSRFWPEPEKAPVPKPPPCEDHPYENSVNCRCCWSDVKVGIRPADAVGKHWEVVGPEPEPVVLVPLSGDWGLRHEA